MPLAIIELPVHQLPRLKGLWQELNAHHKTHSTYFKTHFASLTFETRVAALQSKEHLMIYAAQHQAGEIVGYCIATVDNCQGEVDSLYLKEAFRAQGMGTVLLEKALHWLQKQHCQTIRVNVAEGNETALPFYEKCGFRERFRTLQLPSQESP